MMNKRFCYLLIYIIPAIFSTWLLAGCKKVIQLKTDDITPKYVIEANLSDIPGDCKVYISKTIRLSDSSYFAGISGAAVTITPNGHNPVYLHEMNGGLYETSGIIPVTGLQYTLTVDVEGNHFTSTAYMPRKISFDSLYVSDYFFFGENRKFANVAFDDPPGKGNSYRFLQFKNDKLNSNIFVLNDQYSDGRHINTFLAYFDQSDEQEIASGDVITVEMQCIDPAVYKFFNSLALSSTGGEEAVAPGNPVTNIQGGALGYFNVYTKAVKTVVAP